MYNRTFFYQTLFLHEIGKNMKRIIITGAAGFIGFHLALRLKARGDFVIGVDNFNSYYSPSLKKDRALELQKNGIEIIPADICNKNLLKQIMLRYGITHFVHLAAQAGVRHSIHEPDDYVTSNLEGFVSCLEACRNFPDVKLTYASSSSVYGLNQKIPFKEDDRTDLPTNLYGATKKANELLAHSYHHLYDMHVTGLRYFTVYGPWGRPDMAYFRFTKQIQEGQPISVFNHGLMKRDFTYIDDIVSGTIAAIDLESKYEIFNLGNNRPIQLLYLIELLEEALGKKAIKELLPMQPGEVIETYADIEKSGKILNFKPQVPLEKGIVEFVNWYNHHFNKKTAALCF